MIAHPVDEPDTADLVRRIPAVALCLKHAVLLNCNAYARHHGVLPVSFYPLSQMAPAFLLYVAGVKSTDLITHLVWLNLVAIIIASVIVIRWSYRRAGAEFAVLGGLLFVPGMLVVYMGNSFGEALAVLALVGVVVAGLRQDRMSPWLGVAAAVASVTKETEAPFVLVFGLAAIMISGSRPPVSRQSSIAVFVGTGIGLVLTAGLNLFRYGTILNSTYLSIPHSPDSMVPSNFAALLVAPNGGILWFWPGAAIAMVVLIDAALVHRSALFGIVRPVWVRRGAVLAVGGFFLYVLSLALWWDPFGWFAWGPRLLMPAAAPAIALALPLIAAGHPLRRPWVSPLAGIGLAVASIAVLVPTLGFAFGVGNEISMIRYVVTHHLCTGHHLTIGSRGWDSCVLEEDWNPGGTPLLHSFPTHSVNPLLWVTEMSAAVAIVGALGFACRAGAATSVAGHRRSPRTKPSLGRSGQPSQVHGDVPSEK